MHDLLERNPAHPAVEGERNSAAEGVEEGTVGEGGSNRESLQGETGGEVEGEGRGHPEDAIAAHSNPLREGRGPGVEGEGEVAWGEQKGGLHQKA